MCGAAYDRVVSGHVPRKRKEKHQRLPVEEEEEASKEDYLFPGGERKKGEAPIKQHPLARPDADVDSHA